MENNFGFDQFDQVSWNKNIELICSILNIQFWMPNKQLYIFVEQLD